MSPQSTSSFAPWVDSLVGNQFFEQKFFNKALPNLLPELADDLEVQFDYCQKLFAEHADLDNYNESQLEDAIIKPLLLKLGWNFLAQETKTVSGQSVKPDFCLFTDAEKFAAHTNLPPAKRHDNWDGIEVLVEAKRATAMLDTKKAAREDNPYFQLVHYLQSSRINQGFLTNGRHWGLVDNTVRSASKRFLLFPLNRIVAEGEFELFQLFWKIFNAKNFAATADAPAPITVQIERDAQARLDIEDDLRRLIYGEGGGDSIFEDIGRAIFEATGADTSPEHLQKIYENSLYFLFRLVFIAYFESRHRAFLRGHQGYNKISLWKVLETFEEPLQEGPDKPCVGWYFLKELFTVLDEGQDALCVPLLNGGLFSREKAPLLNDPRLFPDTALYSLLNRILNDAENNERDFSALSVAHLGTIYEGLLEFEFRIAEEALEYISTKTKEGWIEGYFDAYDRENLKPLKGQPAPVSLRNLAKGSFYLVSTSNNRKVSGSYYTPEALSRPLVENAIDHQLEGPFKKRSITEMRILDNACGSGHLLIEALNVLTVKAQGRLAGDKPLRNMLDDEYLKMEATLKELGMEPVAAGLDEFAVLKRILLKKVIFGVDLSPFAVELAQLAFWIDTFIFGTPLSFIEHHLKAGNSLIGTTIDEAEKRLAYDLFANPIREKILGLKAELHDLSALNDSTQADILASKAKYYGSIEPSLRQLNWYLDIVNHLDILALDPSRRKTLPPIENLAVDRDAVTAEGYPRLVDDMKKSFGFFNWEVEFPNAFIDIEPSDRGFHIIIGNPPWDKTKFEDPMFFSQYRSNYRVLKESAKKTLAHDLLAKDYIRKKYDREQSKTRLANEYFKAKYPLNKGAGDGNLYRFFVERNLGFLAENGSLNYVLPTALLTEDGAITLRQHILGNFCINYFDGFENREKIFPKVDSRYKFGEIQIEKKCDPKQKAKMRFMLTDPAMLKTTKGRFTYSVSDLKAISPKHLAYAEAAGGKKDIDLLKRLYKQHKPLDPKWLDFRNELHATADKKLFKEQKAAGFLPLYKGASIWQYHAKFAEPEYWLDPKEFDDHLRDKEINRLVADICPGLAAEEASATQVQRVLQLLDLKKKEDLGQFIQPDRDYLRLVFRGIASDTNERTLVSSLVPCDIGAQHSLWLSLPKRYTLTDDLTSVHLIDEPLEKLLFAQAIFNSLPVDWILRFSVLINVSKTYLTRIPLPQPDENEMAANPVYQKIIRDSALLSLYNTPELLSEIKAPLKIQDSELIQTPKQYDAKKIGQDIAVARLYGLSADDLRYIAAGFKVLNEKHPPYIALLNQMADELGRA